MFPSAASFLWYFDHNDDSKGYFLLRTDHHHVFSLTSSIATRVGLATFRMSVRLTRHQHVRWCEHLKITPMRHRPSKSKQKPTAVYEHISGTGHQGALDDFEIIGRESSRNDFFLRVKESLLIKKHKPKLNENEASTPLSLFWVMWCFGEGGVLWWFCYNFFL